MRFLWLVPLVAVVCAAQTPVQHFPNSSLDIRGDGFKSRWYSAQLVALQEPSLLALAKVTSNESYRFLWLRTFHHPVAVRLDVQPDGTSVLTTKMTSGAGGFRPGVLTDNNSQPLSREQTQRFLLLVDKVNFWKAPNPVDDQNGADGSQWVIEGVKGGHYHVVDLWMPKDGVARELGMLLAFDLAKMNIPKSEIY